MCQLHRMPSGGLSCSCIDVTVEIIVFSSSQFLDMCSVPTVAALLQGMAKVLSKVTEMSTRNTLALYISVMINCLLHQGLHHQCKGRGSGGDLEIHPRLLTEALKLKSILDVETANYTAV